MRVELQCSNATLPRVVVEVDELPQIGHTIWHDALGDYLLVADIIHRFKADGEPQMTVVHCGRSIWEGVIR